MSIDCSYVFNELVPEKGPVAFHIEVPANLDPTSVVSHRLKDRPSLKKKVVENCKSISKMKSVRMLIIEKEENERKKF